MHLTFILLSFLAHNCIGSPTQSTGLPRQDWKKWKRSQLLFNVRCLAPSNVQGLRFLSNISWVQLEKLAIPHSPQGSEQQSTTSKEPDIVKAQKEDRQKTFTEFGLGPAQSQSSQVFQPSWLMWILHSTY